ncbi:Ino eighty subunit 1 [Yarrowia sp. B02]|nr:Ino eighty subunit 1 [Yarrowia sp. B02]
MSDSMKYDPVHESPETPKKEGSPGSAKKRQYQPRLTNPKILHLKKKDGEPLWRVDIQFDFLSCIFRNEMRVFSNRYNMEDHNEATPRRGGYTFADCYIKAMAKSPKCSRVLHDKLMGDREAGLNMAMVCLLVNIGRMNTTLNFFPEMRAQLRTYHPIPSLQNSNSKNEYKQLQDAPRLKSILKGACEGKSEPDTINAMISNGEVPHCNAINLVSLLSSNSAFVNARFFYDQFEFCDLIMDSNLSSASRAQAFLWLAWAFLETNLEEEELLQNPFGSSTTIPELVELLPHEAELENVDTEEEKEFAQQMRAVREEYIESVSQSPTTVVVGGHGGGTKIKPVASSSGRSKKDDDTPVKKSKAFASATTVPTPIPKMPLAPLDQAPSQSFAEMYLKGIEFENSRLPKVKRNKASRLREDHATAVAVLACLQLPKAVAAIERLLENTSEGLAGSNCVIKPSSVKTLEQRHKKCVGEVRHIFRVRKERARKKRRKALLPEIPSDDDVFDSDDDMKGGICGGEAVRGTTTITKDGFAYSTHGSLQWNSGLPVDYGEKFETRGKAFRAAGLW